MARYYEEETLFQSAKDELLKYFSDSFVYTSAELFHKVLANTPTADVVPKREVEELKAIIADHKASEERMEELYSNAKAEVALEIIDGILSKIRTMIKEIEKVERCGNSYYSEFNGGSKTALEFVFKDIAELKKKYTEGGEGQ